MYNMGTTMEKTILNYRIIVEKEKQPGKKQKVTYNAYCPGLGLTDFGKSLDEAVSRITNLIKFHIESLNELKLKIPVEKETITVVTNVEVPISSDAKFSYI